LFTVNKNIKIFLNYVVGPAVFCILSYSIYQQIQRQPQWEESLQHIWDVVSWAKLKWGLLTGVLLLLNWGIEAKKWQIVINRIQPLSWYTSFKAICVGTTFAFFTPNRMGEYVGRVLYINEGQRVKAISLTLVCSMAQLMVTLVFGLVGIFIVKPVVEIQVGHQTAMLLQLLAYITAGALLIMSVLFFRLSRLIYWVQKLPMKAVIKEQIAVLDHFETNTLLRILLWSMVRFLVFMAQYFVCFKVFNVSLNVVDLFGAISVVFLILAIVPSIAFLSELGIRWKTNIEVLQLFSTNLVGIMASSLAVWIINLVIPALMGSLLLLNIRRFKYRQQKRRKAQQL